MKVVEISGRRRVCVKHSWTQVTWVFAKHLGWVYNVTLLPVVSYRKLVVRRPDPTPHSLVPETSADPTSSPESKRLDRHFGACSRPPVDSESKE